MKLFSKGKYSQLKSFIAGVLITALLYGNYQLYFSTTINPSVKLDKIAGLMEENYIYEYQEDEFLEYMYEAGMYYFRKTDPYTSYLPKETYEEFEEEINNSYQGIGVLLEGTTIMEIFEDSPAANSDLAVGDKIIEINGQSIETTEDIISLVKNGKESKFTIKVIRGEEEIDVELTKGKIKIPTVKTESTAVKEFEKDKSTGEIVMKEIVEIPEDIEYIKMDQFSPGVFATFLDAVKTAESECKQGLIIDMRNNSGGYVNEAKRIMQYMCSSEDVVLIEETKENPEKISYGNGEAIELPVVILTNKSTASAAEMLTIGLMENLDATVIGETTYGKGVMQATYPFDDGSVLKLTVGKWYSPSGKNVNDIGIIPDIECTSYNDSLKYAIATIYGDEIQLETEEPAVIDDGNINDLSEEDLQKIMDMLEGNN